jgi:hypothetical protein
VPEVEVSREELALILEALEDAAFYRDTRSRVLDSAVKRQRRRTAAPADPARGAGEVHRLKARAYHDLAVKLQRER